MPDLDLSLFDADDPSGLFGIDAAKDPSEDDFCTLPEEYYRLTRREKLIFRRVQAERRWFHKRFGDEIDRLYRYGQKVDTQDSLDESRKHLSLAVKTP